MAPSTRLRVLFLSDFCPWPLDNGFRQRVFHLVDALAADHDVTLMTVLPDELRERPFPPARNCIRLIPISDTDFPFRHSDRFQRWASIAQRMRAIFGSPYPSVWQRLFSNQVAEDLAQLKRSDTFDVVWVERPAFAELARKAGFRKIIVDLPDIESVSYWRSLRDAGWYMSKPLHYLELAKLYVYEQLLPFRFSRLVPCKEADAKFFQLRQTNVSVVPNGVDTHSVAREATAGGAHELLFLGTLGFEPNVEAVRTLCTDIMPAIRRTYPAVRLVVVGRDPAPIVQELADRGACTVLSHVDDLGPCFDSASLFVAPIRLGSGTRLKILEALARGKAVVATTTAIEGLELRPGVDLEVADLPEQFAAACVNLLSDPQRRTALGRSGRLRVLERYLWPKITPLARTIVESVAMDA